MSEEFNCTPDVAANLPFGLCSRIMSLRDYVAARHLIESTEKAEDLQMTPTVEKVLSIQAELAMAKRNEA